jgi:hypothetical protein
MQNERERAVGAWRWAKPMKPAKILVLLLVALALGATPAQAEFGLKNFTAGAFNKDGSPATEAGSHPYLVRSTFQVNTRIDPDLGEVPDESAKLTRFYLPPGFIGSRTAVPTCTTADFLTVSEAGRPACPDVSAIGATTLRINDPAVGRAAAVYNLVPPPGVAAKFGFIAINTPVTVEVGINDRQPFNLIATALNIPQAVDFYGADLQIWGIPSDHSHDPFRGNCLGLEPGPNGELLSGGICNSGAAEVPFLTLPRSCTQPQVTSYEAVSWQHPNAPPVKGSFPAPDITGCSSLNFSPGISAKPTAATAESASGLDFEIEIKDEGLANPKGPATQSDIKKAVVTLPAGMTVNPSSANGLAACSPAGYAAESLATGPGQGCPLASKIGEVEVESPLLAKGETLHGSVFLAEQENNPFGTLIALYMVIKNHELGVLVKLPLKVEPNEERGPNAGRLVTTLDESPQLPFSHFHFHFTEGARGPLLTPPACGTYITEAQFTPWSDPANPVTETASFKVSAGVGGGPCPPGGVPPFNPTFSAGSLNNNAGAYSPFNMRLTRADGDQEMTRFDAVLPKGVTGKLAGIARCPDSAIATAKAKTGRQELAVPSCPAASQIGTTLAGAGVGAILTYVPGKLYLGGPVGKAPLSVIGIVPAVAGPFDVGTVVVREALTVDPETAEVKVDGSISDPIPNILRGLPVKLKDLRVYTERPNFTLNPTSCSEKQAKATLFGSFLDVFSSADDAPAQLTDRYQAASCASLKFKPNLALKLKGGTKRGAHPALRAIVTYPPAAGYANTKKAVVTFPHSAFLEQAHIRTVCTRVQFAAKSCPAGSVYGKVRAFTPLLDEPLEGPVYLRSSSNPLPDLVFAFHGLVDFNAVARIDSVNASIRANFDSVPDVPLSKVIVEMQGGKKGLIVNSRNLCAHKSRATAAFTAHSGKAYKQNPVVKAGCGGK